MRRVVSVLLPRWPTNRPRRKDHAAPPRDKPLVLAAMDEQRRIVASLDEAASALGLSRNRKALQVQPRDIYIPDLHIDTLKVKARNFR